MGSKALKAKPRNLLSLVPMFTERVYNVNQARAGGGGGGKERLYI